MRKFIRLNITAEGQTEERFVKQTLSEYLGGYNIAANVRCVLTSKDKRKYYRGGIISYDRAKKDILTWLKEDHNTDARFTTMFDLYGLPTDFPGMIEAEKITDPYQKVKFLESSFSKDINDNRFIPYIQLYEFETLILSEPAKLEIEYFDHKHSIEELKKNVSKIGNPELINDGPETSPSKRIIKLIPEYEYNKASSGATVAGKIGVNTLKAKCQHFSNWISKLEALSF